jgi:hypothetical protein
MRLAALTWNDRASPIFDTAGRLLLPDVADGIEQGRHVVEITQASSSFPGWRAPWRRRCRPTWLEGSPGPAGACRGVGVDADMGRVTGWPSVTPRGARRIQPAPKETDPFLAHPETIHTT